MHEAMAMRRRKAAPLDVMHELMQQTPPLPRSLPPPSRSSGDHGRFASRVTPENQQRQRRQRAEEEEAAAAAAADAADDNAAAAAPGAPASALAAAAPDAAAAAAADAAARRRPLLSRNDVDRKIAVLVRKVEQLSGMFKAGIVKIKQPFNGRGHVDATCLKINVRPDKFKKTIDAVAKTIALSLQTGNLSAASYAGGTDGKRVRNSINGMPERPLDHVKPSSDEATSYAVQASDHVLVVAVVAAEDGAENSGAANIENPTTVGDLERYMQEVVLRIPGTQPLNVNRAGASVNNVGRVKKGNSIYLILPLRKEPYPARKTTATDAEDPVPGMVHGAAATEVDVLVPRGALVLKAKDERNGDERVWVIGMTRKADSEAEVNVDVWYGRETQRSGLRTARDLDALRHLRYVFTGPELASIFYHRAVKKKRDEGYTDTTRTPTNTVQQKIDGTTAHRLTAIPPTPLSELDATAFASKSTAKAAKKMDEAAKKSTKKAAKAAKREAKKEEKAEKAAEKKKKKAAKKEEKAEKKEAQNVIFDAIRAHVVICESGKPSQSESDAVIKLLKNTASFPTKQCHTVLARAWRDLRRARYFGDGGFVLPAAYSTQAVDDLVKRIIAQLQGGRAAPAAPAMKKRSRYVGVCWHKGMQKWRASIMVAGVRQRLGCFDDEADGARAYDAAVAAQNLRNPRNLGDKEGRDARQPLRY